MEINGSLASFDTTYAGQGGYRVYFPGGYTQGDQYEGGVHLWSGV